MERRHARCALACALATLVACSPAREPTGVAGKTGRRASASLLLQLEAQPPPTDPCVLLGAITTPGKEVRLFSASLRDGRTALVGPVHPALVPAGVAVHPLTGTLYALVSEGGASVFRLVTVDRASGVLADVGSTGLPGAGGLAFRPTDGTLWTWASGRGPATLDATTGAATIAGASDAAVTDLAFGADGAILYAASGRTLRAYDVATGQLGPAVSLPASMGGLAMRSDGQLILAVKRPGSGLEADDLPPGLVRPFSFLVVDPATGATSATLEVDPIAVSAADGQPDVAAGRVDALTWQIACGNASPGGPADVIVGLTVEPRSVCPGESVRVEVDARHPEGGTNPVAVTVNGIPGASRWLQLEGTPGPRTVEVTASTLEGYHESESVAVEVVDCPAAPVNPVLRARPDPYAAYSVDLEIQNAAEVAAPGSLFRWEFGDGTTLDGDAPFVRHSYAGALSRDVEFPSFDVKLTVVRPDGISVEALKAVTVHNDYVASKRRGLVRPPVTYDSAAPLRAARARVRGVTAAAVAAEPWIATYTITNIEDHPIRFVARQIEQQPCDPAANPVLSPWEPLTLEIPGGGTSTQSVAVPAEEAICGVAVHLAGDAGLLHRAGVDVYFEVRDNELLAQRVSDGSTLAALQSAASQGLLAEQGRAREEDLFQLSREGRIPAPGQGTWTPPPPDPEPDPIVGTPCMPGDTPPHAGVSCQATDEWWTAPPHLANALKGDIVLSTDCEMIALLLRNLVPPQVYSHTGIMTENHYRIAHSTSSEERYEDEDYLGVSGIQESVLRYGWPGAIEQPIADAFGGVHMTDSTGKAYWLKVFSQNPAACANDAVATMPLVVRPPPGEAASVRAELEAAADIAANAAATAPGHYRFYAYTDARIAFDPAYDMGGPATMCSSFVWRSLKLAGVNLEGVELEPEDVQNGASVALEGLVDGLYAYDPDVRNHASTFLWNTLHDAVYENARWWFPDPLIDLTGVADHVATQFTNCFARDACRTEDNESDLWKVPNDGRTVSPQDVLFWDPPSKGGAYGWSEPLAYRSAEYVQVFRWATAEGAGDVRGTVTYEGAPVEGARVTLYADGARETATSADGKFKFLGVPSGAYQIVAQKETPTFLLQADETLEVPSGGHTARVDLVLTPPPESFRRVSFWWNYKIVDENWPLADEVEEGTGHGVCSVDPTARTDGFTWENCVGNEVFVRLSVTCTLDEFNRWVRFSGSMDMWEQADCTPTDYEGSDTFDNIVLPGATVVNPPLFVENPKLFGSDTAEILLGAVNETQY